MQGLEESESQCFEGTGKWLSAQVGLSVSRDTYIKDFSMNFRAKIMTCAFMVSGT